MLHFANIGPAGLYWLPSVDGHVWLAVNYGNKNIEPGGLGIGRNTWRAYFSELVYPILFRAAINKFTIINGERITSDLEGCWLLMAVVPVWMGFQIPAERASTAAIPYL